MKQTCYQCLKPGECLLVRDLHRMSGPIWVHLECMTKDMHILDGDLGGLCPPKPWESLGLCQRDWYADKGHSDR